MAILRLFIEKSNIEDLIKDHSNALIWVIKSVDEDIIKVKALKQWQKLKVHKLFLLHYFEKRKKELLCCKIKYSIRIRLKNTP